MDLKIERETFKYHLLISMHCATGFEKSTLTDKILIFAAVSYCKRLILWMFKRFEFVFLLVRRQHLRLTHTINRRNPSVFIYLSANRAQAKPFSLSCRSFKYQVFVRNKLGGYSE